MNLPFILFKFQVLIISLLTNCGSGDFFKEGAGEGEDKQFAQGFQQVGKLFSSVLKPQILKN